MSYNFIGTVASTLVQNHSQKEVVYKGVKLPSGNSIHHKKSIEYYEKVVGAGEWQLDVVKNGLTLDWKGEAPGKYREVNNKSAVQGMSVIREKVAKWMKDGHVEKVEEQPWCTNPLSVAAKYDPVTDTTKFRPVIDLSRHVNKHVKEVKVKLDDLGVSEVLIEKNDFMGSFDLENQFFHVNLAPEFKKYFGFALPKEGGGGGIFPIHSNGVRVCTGSRHSYKVATASQSSPAREGHQAVGVRGRRQGLGVD